jgi:uncharacterized protein (TIGR02302 family)
MLRHGRYGTLHACYVVVESLFHAENWVTEQSAQVTGPDRRAGASGEVTASFDRAVARARWTIFWERLWPALASISTAVGFFLAVSWGGLWLSLPPMGRAIGLFAFGFLAAIATRPLLRLRMPTTHDGLRRLDLATGLPHRPATAIADDIASSASDPWSIALWHAHVERALRVARSLSPGWPAPRLPFRDPFAVRALVLMLVIATFFAATGERGKRIAAAFDWQGVVNPANFRLDAWVSPPAYTNKPPIILPGVHPGERSQASTAPIVVPAGSSLVIRASGKAHVDVTTSGGLTAVSDEQRPQVPAGAEEHRFTIADHGTATVRGVGDEDLVWTFSAIPDRPPTIALAKDPEPQARGGLQLVYKLEDDYGVTDAKATFALKQARQSNSESAHPLYGPPDFTLTLPQARTRNGVGQMTKDLTDHPWAGTDVTMTLVAHDEAGNEGKSEPYELHLPERIFVKPLARALIEQRRILALDAGARDLVLIALDALALEPERFTPEPSIYLGLRSIYWDLAHANSDNDLREVVQRLWSMATQIEDGNVSDAEAALRNAQEALRQALERGASEDEIKRLTDELRAALDKFMQALAEQMRKNPQQLARPLDPNTRLLRPQDLQSMIDRLENLARSGAKDAARQLLDQLQQMLENLQTARPGQMEDGDGDDMMSALDDLGNMIHQQQQLRDRTFRQGQDQRQRGQRGSQGRQGQQDQQGNEQNPFGELQQNQQALRDQLNKLMQQLREHGLGQNSDQDQNGADQFGRAGEAMQDAEGALGESNADNAVDAQGKALDALRKGAQNLAQSMQQQGIGQGPGQPGRMGQTRAQSDTDPLGRPMRGRDMGDDSTVKVPGEIDVQRARRILEELRRRYADPTRPQIELDYIERLLKDFL